MGRGNAVLPAPTLTVVSYGGGTNSAAMLVGLLERGERPDCIVFCDTGSEKPNTYAHILEVSEWCATVGFPTIQTIRGSQPRQIEDGSLERECLRLGAMPSKAMGFGACSQKWKVDPFQKWVKAQAFPAKPTRLVGFDADEPQRMERAQGYEDKLCERRYPLIEWDWGRDECVAAIARAGLSQPGKSACFFCPSSKKHEILTLRDEYPELLARALEIERRALAGEGQAPAFRGKGLGRHFAWADVVKMADAQLCMFSDAGVPEMDCGCYDG